MSRAELENLFDQIIAILEGDLSPVEKLERIEAVMFDPTGTVEESDEDEEEEDPDDEA